MKILSKWLRFIWCKTLHIHWYETTHTVYADGTVEPDPDTYCRLCGYYPGQDDESEYTKDYYNADYYRGISI